MAAMVMFATSHDKVVMTVLSVCQGLSVGLYISTSVSIQMKLAGESLGASAVGFVYSFRYVTIVIVTPIAAAIAKVN